MRAGNRGRGGWAGGGGRLVSRGWLAVGMAGVLISLVLASAAAAAPKQIAGYVGSPTVGSQSGLFAASRDAAVYTGGDADPANDMIFVAEGSDDDSSRILRLDMHGNFERAWGRDVIAAGAPGDAGTGFEICTVEADCRPGALGSGAGEFNDAIGIAVDPSTGHVYVIDRDNRRVQEFTPDGGFVRAWGWGVDTGAAQFEICTSSCQAGVVDPSAALNGNAGQIAATPFRVGIAVRPTAPHHVYVTDPGNRRVLEYEPDGDFVQAFGWGVDTAASAFETCTAASGCEPAEGGGTENGRFGSNQPQRIVVDGGGVVYATDSALGQRVMRVDSDPAALLEALPSPSLLAAAAGASGSTTLEVDPGTGNLFVMRDRPAPLTSIVQEIENPGAPLSGGPPNPAVVETHPFIAEEENTPTHNQPPEGLAFNPTTDDLYVVTLITRRPGAVQPGVFTGCFGPPLTRTGCDGLFVLADVLNPPTATPNAPSNVGPTTADITGTVNAGGGWARYVFEFSRDGETWVEGAPGRNVGGTLDVDVSAQLSGLEPNTLYRVRMKVRKQTGLTSALSDVSSEQILLTDAIAPDARTRGSAHRTASSAQLRALINPNNAATSYYFELGLAGGSFDRRVPLTDASAGAGGTLDLVTQDVDGLLADTAYQYRVVAENFVGATVGDTVEFRTKPQAPPPPPPGGRAYELVSPADKIGGQGVSSWYRGPASHASVGVASYDGERFAVSAPYGSVISDGAYAYATDWALAERASTGWVSKPAMTRSAHGKQSARMLTMPAATEDLALSTWSSNAGLLKLFEEMEDWDESVLPYSVFVRDWDGRWEIVGPTATTQLGGSFAFQATGIAADRSVVVGSSRVQGLAGPGDPSQDGTGANYNVIADDVSGGLSNTFPGDGVRSVVNVCTDGTLIPRRLGSGKVDAQECEAPLPGRDARLIDIRGASLGQSGERALERVVSPDGGRVFFMSPDPEGSGSNAACSGVDAGTACPPQLYVRQRLSNGDFVTRWISRSEVAGQDASLLSSVSFEGASVDGDKVFFRTAAPLTEDDPNGGSQVLGGVTSGSADPDSDDLYMYDFPDAGDPGAGNLTRISAGPSGDGDADVSDNAAGRSGAVRFMSGDGSRVYFTSAAPLPDVPLPGDGTITEPGGDPTTTSDTNLYAYDADLPSAERWRFVARLPRASTLGECATENSNSGPVLTAFGGVGPIVRFDSGNCLRGTSDGSFVTFWTDGRLVLEDPDEASGDVYGYDAASDELMRLSAPQGVGGTYTCAEGTSSAQCYADTGFGSAGAPLQQLGVATDPSTPGDRVAFFQSRSNLVAEDTDSAYDVYEWRNGELSLLSVGGSDPDGIFYQGNDRSGDSVFLSTLDRLSWQDRDSAMDVYVARVGNGIPQPPPRPPCDAGAGGCQGGGAGKDPVVIDRGDSGSNANIRRVQLSVAALSKRARTRAARTGVVALRVKAPVGIVVSASAKARVGRKMRRVASANRAVGATGAVTVRLRLNGMARQRLRSGKRLRLSVTVSAGNARTRTMGISLKGGRR
jgi:hypothetical protein